MRRRQLEGKKICMNNRAIDYYNRFSGCSFIRSVNKYMYCKQCGLCCKLFNFIELPEEYQQLNDGTGKCKYLEDNRCSIYQDRPLLCNSHKIYEINNLEEKMSFEEYEAYLSEKCKELQAIYGELMTE